MKQARFVTMLGIGCITMAILATEIVLTRIFSVTLWYHFAFLVISLALLGSGAAGVWLYLLPGPFAGERAPMMLPWLALGYAFANLAAYLVYQQIPLHVDNLRDGISTAEVGWLAFMYAELTVPFIFAGATVALALKHYQAQAGRLYFADLVGASIGCLLSVAALSLLDGPGALVLTSALGALAAFLLALGSARRVTLAITGGTLALAVIGLAAQVGTPWLNLRLHRTYNDVQPVSVDWNTFSRISVYDDTWAVPFGWGISQVYYRQERRDPGHFTILIDEKAGTPIQRHVVSDGVDDWDAVDFLAYDVTALPYYVRPEADVFVIGPGGGRDVLTAMLFGAQHVTGVELNPIIVDLVQRRFSDYTGDIYSRPNVEIHVDDARSYLAAHEGQYDIIQASLIDTFAATSAGAFALSENGIYTVEAFEAYYDHLTDDGMVNFSRWYYADGPAETLRLVSVAMQAWADRGVENLSDHIIVLANLIPDRIQNEGLAGMLLKKSPFTQAEIDTVLAEAERLEFAVLYAPGITAAEIGPVASLVLAENRQTFIDDYALDISPATDNRPFFFNVVRLGDLNKPEFMRSAIYGFGAEATRTLLLTLGIAIVLSAALVILPLALGRGRTGWQHGGSALLGYYALLGLGFIMVEIPMVQKMSLYLGNPTYALVVILFALLLFSGVGSFLSQRVPVEHLLSNLRIGLIGLIGLILLYVVALPVVLNATQGLRIELRAVVVVILLMPTGLLMGRPFPLGLRYVDAVGAGGMTPWLWAANGTLSVVGSVLATILAIQVGFAAVFGTGVLAYALALGISLRFGTSRVRHPDSASILPGYAEGAAGVLST
ncbi:MAG: hypothetical protein KJ065_12620 [Anaerolineae bacterium]|nr:hypothetical protein [Anaerolineae bacterium]